MKFKLILFFSLMSCFFVSKADVVGTCNPYFVSIAKSEVNMRQGPGEAYKIRFVYIIKGTPLKVVAKFNDWRKVQDPDGEQGWIKKSLLSAKRFIIFQGKTKIYKKPNTDSIIIGIANKNVVARLLASRGNWCEIKHESGISGWIQKSQIFGVLENENW